MTKELSKDITNKPKTENKHFNWPFREKKSNIVPSIEKQKGSNLKKQLKTVKFQIKFLENCEVLPNSNKISTK